MIGEKPKFEARLKDQSKCTYGVWNNDMWSWQYILDLDAYETQTWDEAVKYAEVMNNHPLTL